LGARSSAKIEAPRGWGAGRRKEVVSPSLEGVSPSLPGKFFITYSRKGAFWWIPDAF